MTADELLRLVREYGGHLYREGRLYHDGRSKTREERTDLGGRSLKEYERITAEVGRLYRELGELKQKAREE